MQPPTEVPTAAGQVPGGTVDVGRLPHCRRAHRQRASTQGVRLTLEGRSAAPSHGEANAGAISLMPVLRSLKP